MAIENERGNPSNPLNLTLVEAHLPKANNDSGASLKLDTFGNVSMLCYIA